jgi:dipeptidyl aminopeptidase/acylaminoacyl peptidase
MEQQVRYKLPHEDIYSLASAQLAPVLKLDGDGKQAFFLHRKMYKGIEDLSIEEMKLGGMRTNPLNNTSARDTTYHNITHLDVDNGKESPISGLPQELKIVMTAYNFYQDHFAFLNVLNNDLELWVIDCKSLEAKKVCNQINNNTGSPYIWLKDNRLLVNVVAKNRQNLINKKEQLPVGPVVMNNDGESFENRTYQDLLTDEIDEFNFEQLVLSDIYLVDLDGQKTLWKEGGMHDGMSLSPDGNFIMLSEIQKPFAYTVPYDRFAYKTSIYDIEGNHVHLVVDTPLIDKLPQGFMAVSTGRRGLRWRSDQPSTLVWIEAQDGGDPANSVEYRDFVYEQIVPFNGEPRLMFKTKDRFAGIYFGNDNLALIYERWWANRNQRMILFNPQNLEESTLVDERNYQNLYDNPGQFTMIKNQYLHHVLHIEDDGVMYLSGDGVHPGGRRNFIDKYNYKTGEKVRLFECNEPDMQEDISFVLNAKEGNIITVIQSKSDYPNFYKRNIYTGDKVNIRKFDNPFKILGGIHKEQVTYTRADGLELKATMYLPVGHTIASAKDLPMIMYAYPTEYKDKSTASQRSDAAEDFIYPFWGSMLYWANRGYVILDDVSFPIIGEGDTQPNDTYVTQLVDSAKAAIDYMVGRGIVDRNKIGVAGHSYGGFMVAMLLTHTDFFAAGVARSGAYNRTLTPFGFQSEERNYWQAKDVYNAMNPFMDADKMKTPMLLIHGKEDNNPGTFTIQSERYFAALKSQGANVRLVLLPLESHSYAGEESIMHVLAEQDDWFEKYLK